MILDAAAYARLRLDDEHRALAALGADETLAIGEALWTSGLAHEIQFPEEPRPTSLAVRLRIAPARLAAAHARLRSPR